MLIQNPSSYLTCVLNIARIQFRAYQREAAAGSAQLAADALTGSAWTLIDGLARDQNWDPTDDADLRGYVAAQLPALSAVFEQFLAAQTIKGTEALLPDLALLAGQWAEAWAAMGVDLRAG